MEMSRITISRRGCKPYQTCDSTKVLQIKMPCFVFSHSWQVCVPLLPEDALPAVTSRSFNRRSSCSRKPTPSPIFTPSHRTSLRPAAAAAWCLRPAVLPGKMDPGLPQTAHLLGALETQVRRQVELFCINNIY